MLGNLVHFSEDDRVAHADMPGLEKYAPSPERTRQSVRRSYAEFISSASSRPQPVMTVDLSAFYFDIRKDALIMSRSRRSPARPADRDRPRSAQP
jgi:isoleucyl-tRNA synthetase